MLFLRDWMMKNFKEPNYGWPQFHDFYITLIGALLMCFVRKIFTLAFYSYFYRICKEKDDEHLRLSRTEKAVHCSFKAFYYVTSSLWGYLVLKESSYLTPLLFGKGDLTMCGRDYPVQDTP